MKIRSVGHACLEIEAAGKRVLTDPWWAGPAYAGQWHPWPTPRPEGVEQRALDYVYLSHGHEDHLHAGTLERLRPGATALVPGMLFGGMAGYVREAFSFKEVIELDHGVPVQLGGGLTATCYVNLTDSILVLEAEGFVLVDANDALHAAPPAVIEHLCRRLRKAHPRIDALFLGYGSASWFPNCIRFPGKDDRSAARAREQYFLDNFVRIVDLLQPKLAFPFAASFVLLEDQNLWIDALKLELEDPDRYYAAHRTRHDTRCHFLLPSDRIENGQFIPCGDDRPTRSSFERALETELAGFRRALTDAPPRPLADRRALADAVAARLVQNRRRLGRNERLSFAIELSDAEGATLQLEATRSASSVTLTGPSEAPGRLELRCEILEAILTNDYGVEAVIIGYGGRAHLSSAQQYPEVLRLLALLSPRAASWRGLMTQVRESPLETAEAMWRQRWPLAGWVGTRLGLLSHAYELNALSADDQGSPNTARPNM